MKEPYNHEEWQAKYKKACADFKNGVISIHVFRGYLKVLNIPARDFESEINLNWPDDAKHNPKF